MKSHEWLRILHAVVVAAMLAGVGAPAFAQQTPAARLLEQVATAMGGRDRLQRIDTLVYTGFGQDAYMDGGGNITAEVNAPPKWRAIADAQRSIDLKSRRALAQQRRAPMFPFAAPFGLNWNRTSVAAERRRPARSPAARRPRGTGSGGEARRGQRRGRTAGAAVHHRGRHAGPDGRRPRHPSARLDAPRRAARQSRRRRRHRLFHRLRAAGRRAASLRPDEPHRLAQPGDADVPGGFVPPERAAGPDARVSALRRPLRPPLPPRRRSRSRRWPRASGMCASATTMAVRSSSSPIIW